MMGTKERTFGPLCNLSLETLVPANHFYRHLEAKLDLGFVRDLVRDTYKEGGRSSVDPVVFFKLQLVMFFEGIRSERELVRVVADRLSLRWYLGYDLHELLPDHSSLTRIRERYGLATFQRFFEQVVELCRQAGLIWGKELILDGTKVQANAATDSLRSHWLMLSYWRTHFEPVGLSSAIAPVGAGIAPHSRADPKCRRATIAGEIYSGSPSHDISAAGVWPSLMGSCRARPRAQMQPNEISAISAAAAKEVR